MAQIQTQIQAPLQRVGEQARIVRTAAPTIRKISHDDLKLALKKGVADFAAAPTHLIFLGLLYPIIGLGLFMFASHRQLMPLLFPMVAGFAIMAPFAAIGLYEISRLREQGRGVTWRNALEVLHAPSRLAIAQLGAILLTLFIAWLGAAQLLYAWIFGGAEPMSLTALLQEIFSTRLGMELLIIGHLVGACFAAIAFTISAVSFPMMLDRKVDVDTAIATSLRAITTNPLVMLEWAALIAVALMIGSVPLLMGLPIIVPILAHASWHLYRRVVA